MSIRPQFPAVLRFAAMKNGKLVLIIGPSGVGKSVILRALLEHRPDLHVPKSATTRQRRPGEGDDLYHFVTDPEFDDLATQGKFLEWAVVHHDARYGTLIEEIIPAITAGYIVLREVDVQGFDAIRKHPLFHGEKAPYRLQTIFILPESKEILIGRITRRAPIGREELQRRIASMERELTYADACDVRVINREGDLEATIKEVEHAVFLP